MNAWHYIGASLRHYRRVHLAVAAGVAVATAVMTGALLVGDSVRGSLRHLVLRGLGRIDAVVLAETPFRAALAAELHASPHVAKHYRQALPLLLSQGAATRRDDARQTRRATGLSVVGVTPEFWTLAGPAGAGPPAAASSASAQLKGNEVALTADVARELGAAQGDFIVLRVPSAGSAPADSSLGEKEDATASRRLRVAHVLDDAQRGAMARFALRPSQQAPRNAFVPLEMLAELLEIEGRANAILLAGDSVEQALPPAAGEALQRALKPTMADYGVTVEEVRIGGGDAGYVRIAADRLVAPPHLVEVAQRLFGGLNLQPAVTYLANTIVAGDRKIPYSTVVGVDSTRILGPVVDDAGDPIALAADEVALNDWAARELGASIGDEIALTFYEPETTHGQLREHAPLRLKLRAILPLADEAGRPTAAADPHFAPELPGVTDQESIDAWELPFELVEEV
ncbi:MAG TPA: hypothetical protein VEQ85_15665, partial [Lacipirellulaceae bacterium]|nr:hypothetical protein [Lacipirellulaceae bacterium]